MVKKLKQFATIQMGYSFRSRLEAVENGNVAVIQMKDLASDNTVNCTELANIDMDFVKEHHLVQKGDLIFRSRGEITTAAILNENLERAIVAAPLFRIRITNHTLIMSEYLLWFINQSIAQAFLTSRAKGTAQKMISKETLDDMEVFIPDMEKQKVIIELAALSAKESNLLTTLAEKHNQYTSNVLIQLAKGE
jgi:restriction endonuclease S subunit